MKLVVAGSQAPSQKVEESKGAISLNLSTNTTSDPAGEEHSNDTNPESNSGPATHTEDFQIFATSKCNVFMCTPIT